MAAGVLAWHLSGGDAIPRGNAGGEQAWGGAHAIQMGPWSCGARGTFKWRCYLHTCRARAEEEQVDKYMGLGLL